MLITLSTDFCRKKLGAVDQKTHPKEQIVLRDHCKWTCISKGHFHYVEF